MLRSLFRSPLSSILKGTLGSLFSNISDIFPGPGGAFTKAFSAAYDILIMRNQFSSAFSSAFTIFERQKEFSSAFSDAFTNDNI